MAWMKRVFVTHIVDAAYHKTCCKWDYVKQGDKLGMRLAVDGTRDHLIRLRGMEGLTFSAEDAHEDTGHATDEDEDEAEEPVPAVDPGEDGGVLEIGDEEENGEVDDTAVTELITFEGAMPEGYDYMVRCPPIDNDLIGETVLFKWDAPGWCTGRVASAIAAASDLRRGLNFHVKYEDSRHPHRQGLQAGTYGKEKQWVVLVASAKAD